LTPSIFALQSDRMQFCDSQSAAQKRNEKNSEEKYYIRMKLKRIVLENHICLRKYCHGKA